jgi:hypothetical protein
MASKATFRKLCVIQRDVGRLRDAVDALYKDLYYKSEQVKTAPQAIRLGDALQSLGYISARLEEASAEIHKIQLPNL